MSTRSSIAYNDTEDDGKYIHIYEEMIYESSQPKYTYRELLAEKIDLMNCLLHDIESPQDDFPQKTSEVDDG